MKKYFILSFFLIVSQISAEKISLEKAIDQAIRMDLRIDNILLEGERLSSTREILEARRWFNLNGSGSYRYASESMEIRFPQFPSMSIPEAPIVRIVAPKSNTDVKLSLVQPLYTGGILKNSIRIQRAKQEENSAFLRLVRMETAAKVKISYFSLQFLQRKIASLDFLLERLSLHLQKIERFYREELVKKSDLLETRTKIQEVELQKIELKQNLEEEIIHFRKLCGISPEEVEGDYREREWKIEEALARLANSHPFFDSLDKKKEELEIHKKILRGNSLPQLHGFSEFHYAKPGVNFFQNEWTPYFQAGLNVSLLLFDWGQRHLEKKIADIQIRQLQNQKSDFLREQEKQLKQAFSRLHFLEEKLRGVAELITMADEDAKEKERLVTENQMDHITYLMAETNRERYVSQREELEVQRELERVRIGMITGSSWEEK